MTTVEEQYYIDIIIALKAILYDLERNYAPEQALNLIQEVIKICEDDMELRKLSN